MENPELHSDTASRGRESLGEGSADLEKLLQTAGKFARVKLYLKQLTLVIILYDISLL